jgi:hypothetical protein
MKRRARMHFCADGGRCDCLTTYGFDKESELQAILYASPEIVLNLISCDINSDEVAVKARELHTSVGNIDILYITKSADIVLVETKLLRNPEATRTVVAQTIDYVKALSQESIAAFVRSLSKNAVERDDSLLSDESFISALTMNLSHGNIRALILGDDIHPNLLSLVNSLQSAPHLAFTVYLARLDSYRFGGGILLNPYLIENTREVERSVISITVNTVDGQVSIDSEAPDESNRSANRPKLTWEQYLGTVEPAHREWMTAIKQDWERRVEDSMNMGVTGFSLGVTIDSKRTSILLVYPSYLIMLSDKARKNSGISDEAYKVFRTRIATSPKLFDNHISSNRPTVQYSELDHDEFKVITEAALACALALKNPEDSE